MKQRSCLLIIYSFHLIFWKSLTCRWKIWSTLKQPICFCYVLKGGWDETKGWVWDVSRWCYEWKRKEGENQEEIFYLFYSGTTSKQKYSISSWQKFSLLGKMIFFQHFQKRSLSSFNFWILEKLSIELNVTLSANGLK